MRVVWVSFFALSVLSVLGWGTLLTIEFSKPSPNLLPDHATVELRQDAADWMNAHLVECRLIRCPKGTDSGTICFEMVLKK